MPKTKSLPASEAYSEEEFTVPSIPEDEASRMAALESYRVLDTVQEQAFDDLVALASHICNTPIALVSLVDRERQWFKAKVGLDADQTPRAVSFCGHAINSADVFCVPDAHQDPRFKKNPLVTGEPLIRFYAGAPLATPEGHRVGTLCVIDRFPRTLSDEQRATLEALARQVVALLELRKVAASALEQRALLSQQAKRLKSSNEDLEQFAYVASHDLKEPTRVMASFAKLLREEYSAVVDEAGQRYLSFIEGASERMQALIDGVLDFARIDVAGKPAAATDANRALEQALLNLGLKSENGSAEIATEKLPAVVADADQLTLVFQNLIGNALKFSQQDTPRVRVWVKEDAPGWCCFAIEDNGIGIEARHHERIFDMFQRLHHRDVFPGTGMGLALCRKSVHRHGGRIWVESELGQGSTFYFTLPQVEEGSPPPDPLSSLSASAST